MTFQYALTNDSVKGKNPNIKSAVTISVLSDFPPLIMDQASNHGGMSSGSAIAVGNFRTQFVVDDPGEKEAALALEKVATNKGRQGAKYTITRYTVQDGEAVKDTEITYSAHYVNIDTIDSHSADKHHVFSLVSCQDRAEVQHMSFKAGSGATKLKTDQNVATKLMVDQHGMGLIQPS